MTPLEQERIDAGMVPVTVWLTGDERSAMAKWPLSFDANACTAATASLAVACREALKDAS